MKKNRRKNNRRRRRIQKVRKRKYTPEQKEAYARKLRKRMTPAEQAVWRILKRRQGEVGAEFIPQGVTVGYIPDFVERTSMLVVEIDGPIHRFLRKQDERRTKHLEEAGYSVIRFTNEQALTQTERVVSTILENCVWNPPS